MEASSIYGAWFRETFGVQDCQESMAFREVGRQAFAELKKEATKALGEGCNALLLNDWKIGGQHNGVADFTPDPELGGMAALAEAGSACRQIGVTLYLRFNLQGVDPKTDYHAEHTADAVSIDRWGVPFTYSGNRWVWLNPGVPSLREHLVQQVRELAVLGVGGLFIVDFFTDKIDFTLANGITTPDQVDWDGGLQTLACMLEAGREISPDFRLVTHTSRDHLTPLACLGVKKPQAEGLWGRAFPVWADSEAE